MKFLCTSLSQSFGLLPLTIQNLQTCHPYTKEPVPTFFFPSYSSFTSTYFFHFFIFSSNLVQLFQCILPPLSEPVSYGLIRKSWTDKQTLRFHLTHHMHTHTHTHIHTHTSHITHRHMHTYMKNKCKCRHTHILTHRHMHMYMTQKPL